MGSKNSKPKKDSVSSNATSQPKQPMISSNITDFSNTSPSFLSPPPHSGPPPPPPPNSYSNYSPKPVGPGGLASGVNQSQAGLRSKYTPYSPNK